MEQAHRANNRLADTTANQVGTVWAQVEQGDLDLGGFRAAAPVIVARANTRGVALADLIIASEATRQLRRPVPPLGLRPTRAQVDQERMRAEIDRILDLHPDDSPASGLTEWARSEPLVTVATAMQLGLRLRGAWWVRSLTGTSCPLCTGWADGRARPPTVRMGRHRGCDCLQQPVFTR